MVFLIYVTLQVNNMSDIWEIWCYASSEEGIEGTHHPVPLYS